MTAQDRKLLSQMVKAGKFNMEIVALLQQKTAHDAKRMIKKMGNKYCCHPDNSPAKGNYGI